MYALHSINAPELHDDAVIEVQYRNEEAVVADSAGSMFDQHAPYTIAPVSNKSKTKGSIAPPVLAIPDDELCLTEIEDKTALPLTTMEWIAQQEKPAAQPYMRDDPTIEYLVAYVARDGIVLDHGLTVAPYPVPTGLVLHCGDKVVVSHNAELRVSHVSEPGEPGQKRADRG